ncbi:MAG: hypothetical protein E7Z76_05395 [Methanobrevibacter sp.]|jgi:hypothetical protein|nr:hypothetical protein [Methanobrevibacter sp.]
MRQQLIAPGFNINQKNINPQDNIPKNIKLVADKIELEIMEATDVKAYITDEDGNPVPNVKISWGINDKTDIGTVITDINGITKKRILKTNSYDTIVTAKYKDVASSIILKKEKRQF